MSSGRAAGRRRTEASVPAATFQSPAAEQRLSIRQPGSRVGQAWCRLSWGHGSGDAEPWSSTARQPSGDTGASTLLSPSMPNDIGRKTEVQVATNSKVCL